jgi:hypothetical protein
MPALVSAVLGPCRLCDRHGALREQTPELVDHPIRVWCHDILSLVSVARHTPRVEAFAIGHQCTEAMAALKSH